MIAHLAALWRGDIPLGQAFWEYAIAYGTIANIVATAAAIATVAAGLPNALAIFLFLMPLPYILTAVVGVARSADKYQGPPHWATRYLLPASPPTEGPPATPPATTPQQP